ncbi:hypothetical protein [Methanofollis fontis]|uniref:hypothetical protein n=1 Tax=Methanofollis fontis TaxID=2052832 RepID=UPI001A9257AE|nr:hypothetical protein [Methanofollis fontis]
MTTLPGVLDHADFSRVSTDLGRCSLCGEGRAAFRSADGLTVLCEGCYARAVREWNAGRVVVSFSPAASWPPS